MLDKVAKVVIEVGRYLKDFNYIATNKIIYKELTEGKEAIFP